MPILTRIVYHKITYSKIKKNYDVSAVSVFINGKDTIHEIYNLNEKLFQQISLSRKNARKA